MNKSTNFISFIFGGLMGSVATWYFIKRKYEKIAEDEIESVRQAFRDDMEQIEKKLEDEMDSKYSKKINDTILKTMEYKTSDEEFNRVNDATNKNNFPAPYVIKPEDFGEFDNYEQISLIYYKGDNVLCDEMNELVDDVEETVGVDSLEHFGEYEDDAVYVRNDIHKCDYEILADSRKYSEVIKEKKHLTEG